MRKEHRSMVVRTCNVGNRGSAVHTAGRGNLTTSDIEATCRTKACPRRCNEFIVVEL